ncbi:uncharacterized protein [Nicotiana tomentosiformis]|uniref:uncharacterized protein n=1 Tax=Nicotiana tomentosiformis TaxID=4098 RepID=UPI00388CDD2F
MANNDDNEVEADTRIVVEETVEDNRGRRFNLNRPLIEDQFENALPRPGRALGDYDRPVYNQGLSSVRPAPIAANNFELKQDFWDGLTPTSRRTLSNAIGGPFMKKTPAEIVKILDELSEYSNQWPSESVEIRKSIGVHQVDATTSVQERGAPGFQNQQRQQYQSPQSNQSSMEDIMKTFIIKIDERLDAHDAATLMSERDPGTLSANTERNPKETVNDVTLRSGQVLKDLTPIQKYMRHEKKSWEQQKSGVEKKKEEKSRREEPEMSKLMPGLPFPQKLSREKLDKQFERFLDVLKWVHVNLPFTEVLSQMPAYAKFLKEVLMKKRKIEETSVVKLTEHCNAILQNKLPQKCGDPGSFTIPCTLGTTNFGKSLCDSGASINLMPISTYRKLEKEI